MTAFTAMPFLCHSERSRSSANAERRQERNPEEACTTMQLQGISATTKITPSSPRPFSEQALSSACEPGSPARASCAGVELGRRDLVLDLQAQSAHRRGLAAGAVS